MDSELIQQFEMFYGILIETATNGYDPSTFRDARGKYLRLRTVLVSNSKLEGIIPRFIIDNPTLDDFSTFIKKERPNSHERRLFLKDAFNPTRNQVYGKENPSRNEFIMQTSGDKMNQQDKDSVFIFHGRDNGIKEETARFLERLELNPIILHEQADKGRTIIEKFEDHSANARYAVVLLTPDDSGRLASEPETSSKPRARQNVIFEMGYFYGSLERGKVCALYRGVEQPSDLHGIIYISVDEAGAWKTKLASELKEAGIKADYEKVVQ